MYDDVDGLIQYFGADFWMMHESNERVLVKFYSLSCNHCHALAPTYKKLATELKGIVKVAVLNCEEAWPICNDMRIDSYPTLGRLSHGRPRLLLTSAGICVKVCWYEFVLHSYRSLSQCE
jgi:thiol-disulfide isomerase/thioredoxin